MKLVKKGKKETKMKKTEKRKYKAMGGISMNKHLKETEKLKTCLGFWKGEKQKLFIDYKLGKNYLFIERELGGTQEMVEVFRAIPLSEHHKILKGIGDRIENDIQNSIPLSKHERILKEKDKTLTDAYLDCSNKFDEIICLKQNSIPKETIRKVFDDERQIIVNLKSGKADAFAIFAADSSMMNGALEVVHKIKKQLLGDEE